MDDKKQLIFKEFEQHLLQDSQPSGYFNSLLDKDWFINDYPYTILSGLQKVPQSPEHHPEGNVWNHTMLTIDEASRYKGESQDPAVFMWAALLHDVGKAPTTRIRKGRITAYDHDQAGEKLARDFLKYFQVSPGFLKKVTALVRWHMQPLFVSKNLPFADIASMLKEVELREVALLSLCDRLGRGKLNENSRREERERIESFVKYCQNIQPPTR